MLDYIHGFLYAQKNALHFTPAIYYKSPRKYIANTDWQKRTGVQYYR